MYSQVSRFLSRGLVSSAVLGERERTAGAADSIGERGQQPLYERIDNCSVIVAAGDGCQFHIVELGHIFNVLHFYNLLLFFYIS